jgi:hypothetical protein
MSAAYEGYPFMWGDLTPEENALAHELGGQAYSWMQDVNEYEVNNTEDILANIPGATGSPEWTRA